MTRIIDFFGQDTSAEKQPNWNAIVEAQHCPFLDRRCYKVRKSQLGVSIGTCTLSYGNEPILICPARFLERKQIFTDCRHLLTAHEEGDELHTVSQVKVPGGSVDYVLGSIRAGKVRDFVGIELQTLDTTGTAWPERRRFLDSKGIEVPDADVKDGRSFGVNWKHTAKTTLVQLHHKIQTFAGVGKHLVLVMQDRLLKYMSQEFSFQHVNEARPSDPMHFHTYRLSAANGGHKLELAERWSTDVAGVAECLRLKVDANVQLPDIQKLISKKVTAQTLLTSEHAPPPPPPADITPEE